MSWNSEESDVDVFQAGVWLDSIVENFILIIMFVAPFVIIPACIVLVRIFNHIYCVRAYVCARGFGWFWYFQGIYRDKLHRLVHYSLAGRFWLYFQVYCTLAAVALYMLGTYFDPQPISFTVIDGVLGIIFTVDYALFFILAEDRLRFFFSAFPLIDLVTIIPVAIEIFVAFVNIGTGVNAPPLRILRILRIIRALRTADLTKNDLKRQLALVLTSVLSIIFISAGIIQVVEQHSDGEQLTYHEWIYFVVVTLTTVGYGDISPISMAGKMVTIFIIAVGLAIVPVQVNELINMWNESSKYDKRFKPEQTPHTVVIGDMTFYELKEILREFLHSSHHRIDRAMRSKKLVILGSTHPPDDLLVLLRNPAYIRSVKYYARAGVLRRDLPRMALQKAARVFLLAGKERGNDSAVMMEYATLKSLYPSIPTIIQLSTDPGANFLLQQHDQTIPYRSLMASLLAESLLHPGYAALMGNLVRTYGEEDCDQSHEPAGYGRWFSPYSRGMLHSLHYVQSLPSVLHGLPFHQAVQLIHQHCKCHPLLIGVVDVDTGLPLLNPQPPGDMPYLMCAGQGAFVLGSHPKTPFYVGELDVLLPNPPSGCMGRAHVVTHRIHDGLREECSNAASRKPQPILGIGAGHAVRDAMDSIKIAASTLARPLTRSSRRHPRRHHHPAGDGGGGGGGDGFDEWGHELSTITTSTTSDSEANALQGCASLQEFLDNINVHTSSAEIVSCRWYPLMHMNPIGPTMEDAVLPRVPFGGHMVLCGWHDAMPLVVASLRHRAKPFYRIVMLNPTRPSAEAWAKLRHFPQVFFVQGSALWRGDLARAGIKSAKRVLLLPAQGWHDAQLLRALRLVEAMNGAAPTLSLLENCSSVVLAEGLQERSNPHRLPDFHFRPHYAAGRVLSPQVLAACTMQLRMNPYLQDIIALLGMGGSHPLQQASSCMFFRIGVPPALRRKTWADAVRVLPTELRAIPIGLYRTMGEYRGNRVLSRLRYTYTNPRPRTRLRKDDVIMVLSRRKPSLTSDAESGHSHPTDGGAHHASVDEEVDDPPSWCPEHQELHSHKASDELHERLAYLRAEIDGVVEELERRGELDGGVEVGDGV